MATHNELGAQGEDLAQGFLIQKGHQILERNWRYSKGEIDLITKEGDILVFIEVKTRSNHGFGNPEEFVDKKKMEMISKTAAAYMASINYDWAIRFDVIGILIKKGRTPIINHFEDAFFLGI